MSQQPDSPDSRPDASEAMFGQAMCLIQAGRVRDADAKLGEYVAAEPDPALRADRCLQVGRALESLELFLEAELHLRAGLQLETLDEEVGYFLNNNVGYLLNQRGAYAEAAPFCRAAIRHDPLRHNAYKNLGVALQGAGRPEEAARNFIIAARACPRDPRAFYHLAALVAQQRDAILPFYPDIDERLQFMRNIAGAESPAFVAALAGARRKGTR